MSDYMFMLENHLSAIQNRAVAEVQAAAAQANVNLFLTGGAVRDMLGGFPIRDLDFTVEGNALKLAKPSRPRRGAKVTAVDEHRKSAELLFPGRRDGGDRHGAAGALPEDRGAAGRYAGHHSRGPALPRFHASTRSRCR